MDKETKKFKLVLPQKIDRSDIYAAHMIIFGKLENTEIDVEIDAYNDKRKNIGFACFGHFIAMIPKKWLKKIEGQN